MSTAIVVGSRGQDGTILSSQLMARGVRVIGIARQGVSIDNAPSRDSVNITSLAGVKDIVRRYQPDAVYYLAAFHHSSESRARLSNLDALDESLSVQVAGLANFLEAIFQESPKTRLLYASSCHVFGAPSEVPQNEDTKLAPESLYGITKQAGMSLCRSYRKNQRLHASVAILYNHESELRRDEFVSQRVIRGAAEIADGIRHELRLGDLGAVVDWGYAPDYVDAMRRIVDTGHADDFVVATGESHSVRELVECAFKLAELDWTRYVREDPSLVPKQNTRLVGDATKLREATGWAPSVTFEQMVERIWFATRRGVPHAAR